MGRAWPRARIEDTRAQLRQLLEQGTWVGDPGVAALLAAAERLGAPARPPRARSLPSGDSAALSGESGRYRTPASVSVLAGQV